MASQSKVAIVTGGASGMGLAVTEDLVSKGWNVTIFDFNQKQGEEVATRLGSQVHFSQGNAVVYEQQARAFVDTWARWGRIDFVWGNAGVADRIDWFGDVDVSENGAPPQPDILTVDVCLIGVLWTSYLALHFFKKNAQREGRLLFTASSAGIYPSPSMPLYGAGKHGVVGLTRSLGDLMAASKEKITVNCLCPGLVPTPLIGDALLSQCDQEILTPLSTIVRAVNMILQDDSINSQVLECSGKDIIPQEGHKPPNRVAEILNSGEFLKTMDLTAVMEAAKKKGQTLEGMVVRK